MAKYLVHFLEVEQVVAPEPLYGVLNTYSVSSENPWLCGPN